MSALHKIRSNESVPPGENAPTVRAAAEGLVGRTGRRGGERRSGSPDRALTVPGARLEHHGTLPASWPQMILAMLGALAVAITFSSDWPPIDSAVLLVAAVILVTLLRPIRRFTQQRGMAVRLGAVWAVALLPLLLFGMGLTRWAQAGGMDWELAMGGLLCVTCLASIYLRRQPIMIFAAQLCTWLTVVAIHPSLAGWALLAFTLALVVQVVRMQASDDRREEDQRQAAERVNSRARDILAEYEETRQGWFWETDRRGLLTYVSAPVAEVLGCRPAALIGQPLVRLLNLEVADPQCERTLQFHLSSRSAFKELAVQAAIVDDERWWSISGRPVYDGFHNFVGFRGSGTDLTERKRSQEQATRLAHFDSLTGLANRFQMSQSLEKILATPREASRACAVLLLDLDRFKHVNDTMGHPAGDSLLKQVAQRLERAVGKRGQVGRQGGDEFQVIMPGHVDKRVVADVASEIIRSLSQPYSIEGQRVIIGASVGVAMAPQDGINSEALIRNADLALYAAKDGGRGRYHFFANDLHAEAEARAKLEEELRDAIHLGQLQLYYQPIVSTATETISGFEALLRWQHPEKGWISPTKFVQIAEDSGLIGQIGEWALRTACHHLSTWPEEVRVAVNVSALQFASPQLPAIVTSAIAQAGISPSRLELEITESVFLSDDAGTDAMFAALKGIGVRLALDDFGTGYSSLGYLKRAPFDKIKIDQSFVRGATEPGSRNGAIIASITGLAHALGMDTTAEGVETMDELELVRMHGCSHIQGYIYERPLDPEAATQRLQTGLAAVARGPRSARSPRQTMLRRVVLDHHGHLYNGTIRNISVSGALIEGLWNVPSGTMFVLHISDVHSVTATTRWCEDDKLGVEFDAALQRDPSGRISVIQGRIPKPVPAKTA
jgi:diguanylate cyclase (GGDEF)-like protein/PAS domain S-box-containing protein